jgi:hypothetical protein
MSDKLQNCTKCQKEYRAEYRMLGKGETGREFDLSHGMCHTCNLNRLSKIMKIQCAECGRDFEGRVWFMGNIRLKGISTSVCPDCIKKDEGNQKALFLSTVAAVRLKWRQQSGIPPKFQNQDFDTFICGKNGNTAKIHKTCLEYAKGYPLSHQEYITAQGKAYPSLVLFSIADKNVKYDLAGVGKTHLICAIAHRYLDRWKGEGMVYDGQWKYHRSNPVCFISEYELYRRIQATYSYNPEEKQKLESESDIINSLTHKNLLEIDDIGKEPRKDMDFVQRILFAIIDGRYKTMRPIIMTTNKDPDELARYLGEASFDRIFEMTKGVIHQVEGKSYRQKVG